MVQHNNKNENNKNTLNKDNLKKNNINENILKKNFLYKNNLKKNIINHHNIYNNTTNFQHFHNIKNLNDLLKILSTSKNYKEAENILNHAIVSPLFINYPGMFSRLFQVIKNKPFDLYVVRFFLKQNRPLYQLFAVEYLRSLEQVEFAPDVVPFIFSDYPPLQSEAVKYCFKFPVACEPLLEKFLSPKVPSRHLLASSLIRRINPKNIKLALFDLQSSDFIKVIDALNVLGQSGNRVYIKKIASFLKDNDLAVKRAAIIAIGNLGGRQAKIILDELYNQETYPPIRQILSQFL